MEREKLITQVRHFVGGDKTAFPDERIWEALIDFVEGEIESHLDERVLHAKKTFSIDRGGALYKIEEGHEVLNIKIENKPLKRASDEEGFFAKWTQEKEGIIEEYFFDKEENILWFYPAPCRDSLCTFEAKLSPDQWIEEGSSIFLRLLSLGGAKKILEEEGRFETREMISHLFEEEALLRNRAFFKGQKKRTIETIFTI